MPSAFQPKLIEVPPSLDLAATVIIPAKDEAGCLPAALNALLGQVGAPSYEVIVLVNNSTDDTLAVALDFQHAHPELALHILNRSFNEPDAHIGHVRRLLMDEACYRLEHSVARAKAILSTDSDTRAAPDWIAQNLREIERGVDAIGGLITFDPHERASLSPRTRRMQDLDDRYKTLVAWLEDELDPLPHDPWPRHYHHFGASLAVTPEAYRAVGGLPPERQLEDLALFHALLRHDKKFRHSPLVTVQTSARLDGRAPVGLAWQLHHWNETDDLCERLPVDSVAYLEELFRQRRLFREQWRQIGASAAEPLFGEAWERRGFLPAPDQQPIATVIADLENRFTRASEAGRSETVLAGR